MNVGTSPRTSVPVLDIQLEHRFWPSIADARLAAGLEAATTGAAVMRVESAEFRPSTLTFVGSLPSGAVIPRQSWTKARILVRSFHTTWGALLAPKDAVGFLVLAHPIETQCFESVDGDECRIALEFSRSLTSISTYTLGPVCCRTCKQPIPKTRLAAVPTAQRCTKCETEKEIKDAYGNSIC